MATRNADVNLIVRARTDGEKAVAGLTDILETLFDEARGGSHDITELGKTIGALDKAAAAIAGSMDKAGSAVDRQRAKIAESNADYQALLRQQAEAQRVQQKLADFVGPRSPTQTKVYAEVTAEVERLTGAISNLFGRITQQNAQLNGTQSALLNLSATSEAVAQGQAEAEARIELTNRALRDQAEAAERVTEVQRRINDITGVNRPDATGSAARVADILAAADAEYRLVEARAAEIQKLRDEEAEESRLAIARERNVAFTRSQGITSDPRGAQARDSAAAFIAEAEAAEKAQREIDALRDKEADRAEQSRADENRQRFDRFQGITSDPRGAQARDSAAAFIEAAEAERQMEAEAARLRNTLDPLGKIQSDFNTALARYKELAAAGKIEAGELAAAEAHLAAEAEKARAALAGGGGGAEGGAVKLGLFGLKPYELQNLSYQVNDVVTGLASGQRATQVIAQQGGQILQLFPKVAGQVIGALKNPYIAALVVTVGTIALAMKQAANEAQRLREYSSQTTFRADGGSYDPKALNSAQLGIEQLGAKSEDAQAAFKTFLTEGIDPSRLEQFGRAAQETAEVLGIKLPDAAKQVADAFTGGYQVIAQFDDKLNFLTATEREHIRTLFEQGNAEAARTEALNAYTRQADAAAAKQRGPWGEAARSLENAWKSMLHWIGTSLPIRATIAVLDGLAAAAKAVGDAVNDVFSDDKTQSNGQAQMLSAAQDQVAKLKKQIADYEDAIAKKSPISGTLQHLVDESKKQLAAAEANLAKLEKNSGDTLNSDPNSPEAKRRADELHRINAEDELQRLRDAGQTRILSAAEAARREELAGQLAAKDASDSVVAAAEKRRAIAHETATIEKETDARSKQAAADREREIRQFENRVVGAEGGAGKNPHSSAAGFGQFTEGTFLNQFKKLLPGQASSLSRDQILALRHNEQVARGIIDQYARENANFLESFGAKVTAGNLYLAHFLGAGGAKAVLTASPDAPVDQVLRRADPRHSAQVLAGNQGYLRTDGGQGRYRTAGELQSFIGNRVSDTGTAQTEAQVAINKLLDEARQKQNAFDEALRHTNEDHEDTIKALREQDGLYGAALIAAQRQQAVANADREARQKAEDANKNLAPGETPVVVSDDQINKAKELAGALFDAQHASELLNAKLADAQRPLDTLGNQRDLLVQQRDILRSMGEFKAADQINSKIGTVTTGIQDAYDKLIEFYKALSPEDRVKLGILDEQQLDNIIGKLKQAKTAAKSLSDIDLAGGVINARDFVSAFSSSAADSFTGFIKNVAAGKNVFKSFGEGVREFALSFISSITQVILKTVALIAALTVLSAITGIPVQTLALIAGATAAVHHSGGIAGSAGGVQRTVNPSIFTGAMRYHTGGIAGLAPDEVPAILKRGEEVLTQGDPRHRANGGGDIGKSASGGNVTLINVNDPAQALEQALRTPAGEKVLINHVRNNQGAFKAAIG